MSSWRGRLIRWLAVVLLLCSYAMIAFIFTSVLVPGNETLPDRPTLANVVSTTLVFVIVPTVGAILAILRPRNPIGWLFLLCGMGYTIGVFSTEYVGRAIQGEARLPAADLADWFGAWAGLIGIALAIIWIPLLFPDGHLPSRRWRPVAWFAAAYIVVWAVATATQPTDLGYGGRLPNPLGIGGEWNRTVVAVAQPLMAVLGLVAFASVIVRFRRSTGIERRQIKWFLFAVGGLLTATVFVLLTNLEWGWSAVLICLAALPVATGIAILRYRLYEIDRIVSRTIAYSIVTGSLVAVYLVVNLTLTTTFSSLTRVDSVAVAASTLVVAALFTPVRQRVKRVVDHRFDRSRYDADLTAVAFAARLRDEVDLPAVTADLDATVRSAIAPVALGVWLRGVGR